MPSPRCELNSHDPTHSAAGPPGSEPGLPTRVSHAQSVASLAGDVWRLPLVHGGVVVGELTAGAREPGRDLSRRDQATLREVAGEAIVTWPDDVAHVPRSRTARACARSKAASSSGSVTMSCFGPRRTW